MKNAFDNEKNYKLYRTVYDLLHPTISRKNITNYQIILEDDLVPLRVFYPGKHTKLERVIIYVHGNVDDLDSSYEILCQDLAVETDSLVLAIDYARDTEEDCFLMIKYILNNITEVEGNKVCLMGDSSGADVILRYMEHKPMVQKQILFYPELKKVGKIKEKKIPTTLFITTELDPVLSKQEKYFADMKKHNSKSIYKEIDNTPHGFFSNPMNFKREECFQLIKKFLD